MFEAGAGGRVAGSEREEAEDSGYLVAPFDPFRNATAFRELFHPGKSWKNKKGGLDGWWLGLLWKENATRCPFSP